MVSELIDKYLFLLQKISDAGPSGITYESISRAWCNRYGTEDYPKRSFVNHRLAVEEIFGISIGCNRSTNRYYIEEDALDTQRSIEWLVSTFTVNSLLSLGKERLSGRVALEQIPSGQKYLSSVMEAMLDGCVIEIQYRKYRTSADDPSLTETRVVRPYALKEHARRWYVVGYSEEAEGLRVFALDRIMGLEKLERKFTVPEGFNLDELFEASYGIYLPEGETPVTVVFRAGVREAAYLTDLPLHPSQISVEKGPDYEVFAVRVIPNVNFYMDLMARGSRIEVLEPGFVREKLLAEHRAALELYSKQDNEKN